MNDKVQSYGEALVAFNPSGSAQVDAFRQAFAQIIDLCQQDDKPFLAGVEGELWREAIIRALDAQMWAVKAATWGR